MSSSASYMFTASEFNWAFINNFSYQKGAFGLSKYMTQNTARNTPLERRLQRTRSAKGSFVATFRQVFFRHGLTMGFIALGCLLLPVAQTAIGWSSASLLPAAFHYLAAVSPRLLFFVLFLDLKDHKINHVKSPRLAYLSFIPTSDDLCSRFILPCQLS